MRARQRNLLEQSWIGAIATGGNPDGTGDNSLLGVDAQFATSKFHGDKNVVLGLFVDLETSERFV